MLRMRTWAAFSVVVLGLAVLAASCAGVERPDADVCVINVLALHQRCYNLREDYDAFGELKPNAHPHFLPCPAGQTCRDPRTQYASPEAMLAALHKDTVFDVDSWAAFKAWLVELRADCSRAGN